MVIIGYDKREIIQTYTLERCYVITAEVAHILAFIEDKRERKRERERDYAT